MRSPGLARVVGVNVRATADRAGGSVKAEPGCEFLRNSVDMGVALAWRHALGLAVEAFLGFALDPDALWLSRSRHAEAPRASGWRSGGIQVEDSRR